MRGSSSNQLVAFAFNAGKPGENAVYSMKFQWPLLTLLERRAARIFEVFIRVRPAINWFLKYLY